MTDLGIYGATVIFGEVTEHSARHDRTGRRSRSPAISLGVARRVTIIGISGVAARGRPAMTKERAMCAVIYGDAGIGNG